MSHRLWDKVSGIYSFEPELWKLWNPLSHSSHPSLWEFLIFCHQKVKVIHILLRFVPINFSSFFHNCKLRSHISNGTAYYRHYFQLLLSGQTETWLSKLSISHLKKDYPHVFQLYVSKRVLFVSNYQTSTKCTSQKSEKVISLVETIEMIIWTIVHFDFICCLSSNNHELVFSS